MTCDEARAAFSDLYDGVLSGPPLVALDRHLERCPACRGEWAAFRGAIQAMAHLEVAEPSPGFAARLRQRIERPPWWRRAAQALFVPWHLKVPVQAVALAVVAFTAVVLFQRSPDLRRQADVRSIAPAAPAPRDAPGRPPAAPRPAEPGQGDAYAPPADEGGARLRQGLETEAPVDALRRPAPADQTGEPAATAPAAKDEVPRARRQVEQEAFGARGDAGRADEAARGAPAPAAPRPPAVEPSAPEGAPRPAPRAPGPVREEAKEVGKAAPPDAAPSGRQALSRLVRPADDLYSEAITGYARRDYDRAIEAFRAFLAQHPRDPRAADARFRLADAYSAQRRYAEAITEYEALIRQFPASPHVRAALFGQALARVAVGDPAGCQALRDALARYPHAAEAAQAREALAARCP